MSDIIDESILHKKRINDLLVSVEGLKKENRKRCVEVLYENNLTTERRIRAHLILNPDLLTENSVDKYDSDDIIAYLLNEIPTTPSLQVEAGTFAHFQPIGIMLTLFLFARSRASSAYFYTSRRLSTAGYGCSGCC